MILVIEIQFKRKHTLQLELNYSLPSGNKTYFLCNLLTFSILLLVMFFNPNNAVFKFKLIYL